MKNKLFVWIMCIGFLLTGCISRDVPDSSAYPKAYVYVAEGTSESKVQELNWETILASIPEDHYQVYPGLHAAPLTATLYKDNEIKELDTNDPRLIKLMNFYNNMVYNEVYSYTQGSFPPKEYNGLASSDFRLELTYTPNWDDASFETTFDKMLIVDNAFVGVRSETPFGEYPFSSFGRYPLYAANVEWLKLFGF